jgi:hypothetical protein
MMNRELENYYLKQPEPIQGCLLALKSIILSIDPAINHRRMYQIPCFYYQEFMLAFLWVNRKKLLFGVVTDRRFVEPREGVRRKNAYETIEIDPAEDIPAGSIIERLTVKIRLYDERGQ